jgi:cytochrome c peroxidase
MALANATYYINGRFFWDERAATLEEQVLTPVQDSVEMGMRLDTLVARLQSTEFYPILFKYAFGTSTITSDRIAKALAQFVRSMVSYRSRYDEGRNITPDRDTPFANFTAEENLGKHLFMRSIAVNCFGCHNTDAIITDNPRNNGTSLTNDDVGVFIHTGDPMDKGKFKASSLKNVALRGRYMHDGKLAGLDAVLNHYNTGIKANPNLDPHLKDGNGNPARLNLTPAELAALKAFLNTLTDHELINDVKFSSPFP